MSVDCLLNILFIVTLKQIEQAIHKLLNDKASELDSILNEVFKKIIYIFKNDFMLTISKCFVSDVILKIFCEFIMMILRKKKKKDYSLLSSYCLIALKNTITKLIKKLIAEQITDTTEIHSFLL